VQNLLISQGYSTTLLGGLKGTKGELEGRGGRKLRVGRVEGL